MKRKIETPFPVGVSHYAEICPSHLAKDATLRQIFKPGPVRYYPETIEIVEGDMVLIGVISTEQENPEMIIIPMAKLKFSEKQFDEILTHYPKVYHHYRKIVQNAHPELGVKGLSHAQIHAKLKQCCLSAQTALVHDDILLEDPFFDED